VARSLPALIWANAELVYDRPPALEDLDADTRKRVADVLRSMAQEASSEVLIESAYFILGDEGLELLKELTGSGIQVRALTNSLAANDLTTNHSGYARRRPAMLKNGIKLFEFRPDAASCQQLVAESSRCGEDALFGLHAKSIVFDRKAVFVGSFNLNLRSIYLNSETALIVYSTELADRIAADIEENMLPENSWQVMLDEDGNLMWSGLENGAEARYSHEPTTGFWRRLKSGFLSLLPLEKYL
jgi:putative cardiolipin synthase